MFQPYKKRTLSDVLASTVSARFYKLDRLHVESLCSKILNERKNRGCGCQKQSSRISCLSLLHPRPVLLAVPCKSQCIDGALNLADFQRMRRTSSSCSSTTLAPACRPPSAAKSKPRPWTVSSKKGPHTTGPHYGHVLADAGITANRL